MKQILLTLTALLVAALAALHAAEAQRPNVLFILADDLGWADMTLYGHTKFHRTPNLQRLAQRGMLFTRGYSASPLGILRLHLPAQKQPVDVDWVELKAGEKLKRWEC